MAEVVNQFETPLSSQEKEEMLCPESGVLFKLAGYKVDKAKIAAWRLAHSSQGRNETPNEEPIKESILEVDSIPQQEV